jgi:hypothetical protein
MRQNPGESSGRTQYPESSLRAIALALAAAAEARRFVLGSRTEAQFEHRLANCLPSSQAGRPGKSWLGRGIDENSRPCPLMSLAGTADRT